MPRTKNFSFILSPTTIEQLKDAWPMLRLVPDFIIRSSAGNIPPFKVSRLKNVRSSRGQEAEGYLIVCPLLQDNATYMGEEVILDKIISAGRIAERLRSKVLGLGGYGSFLSGQAYNKIVQNLKLPVTSGNALTAWTVIEGIYRAAKMKKLSLKESTAVIIGSDTCIGRLCAVKLQEFVREVIKDNEEAVKIADIVLNADNSAELSIDIKDLKPGAIFCDVSLFNNLVKQAKSRKDITFIRAGLVKFPFADMPGRRGNVISAAMAETILLALEERFVGYSSTENINPDKLEEIADLAARHGFQIYVPEAPAI